MLHSGSRIHVCIYIYTRMYIIYIYIYIYYTYIYYICIHIIILWHEGDAKQLYLVLKVSCWQTDNLQPGTTIIKNLQYNGILDMTSLCRVHFHRFWSLRSARGHDSQKINQIAAGSDPLCRHETLSTK